MDKVYIVGAHSRGKTVAHYLCYLNSELLVEAYLYDNDEVNDLFINGVPVVYFNNNTKLNTNYPVYIGTKGIYHEKLIDKLKEIGFKEIYPVTVELDLKLRNAYLKKYYREIGKTFLKIENIRPTVCVYVAKSIFDKPLIDKYELAEYEKEIQVGAVLTKQRLRNDILTDCEGENISFKNKQYCELTALYWMWKHASEDWVGLVHYRRHFLLQDNWLELVTQNNVDVILPIPLYVMPSIEENYKERHIASDWEYMMEYLKRYHEKDYEVAKNVFKGNLYSPCNMFIMKRKVLNELCCWLFPILEAVEMHGGEKEDIYMNRYPGFVSERLITLFFQIHEDKYKVVYADKNFLQ